MIIRWSKQFPANFQSSYITDVRQLGIQSVNKWRMKLLTCARAGAVTFKIAKLITYELLWHPQPLFCFQSVPLYNPLRLWISILLDLIWPFRFHKNWIKVHMWFNLTGNHLKYTNWFLNFGLTSFYIHESITCACERESLIDRSPLRKRPGHSIGIRWPCTRTMTGWNLFVIATACLCSLVKNPRRQINLYLTCNMGSHQTIA